MLSWKSPCPESSLIWCVWSERARPVPVALQRRCSDLIHMDSASLDTNRASTHCHPLHGERADTKRKAPSHNRQTPQAHSSTSFIHYTLLIGYDPGVGHHYVSLMQKPVIGSISRNQSHKIKLVSEVTQNPSLTLGPTTSWLSDLGEVPDLDNGHRGWGATGS